MTEEQTSSLSFNAASLSAGTMQGTMALMIDIQQGCLRFMEREDARGYLEHMGRVIDDLRERNVPIGWVTIGREGEGNILRQRTAGNGDSDIREDSEINSMNFFMPPGQDKEMYRNEDLFENFVRNHGPRQGDMMFTKEGFSALSSGEPALRNYLQEQGISRVLLSGGMASYCVAATAKDSAAMGIHAIVDPENIIGWEGDESSRSYVYSNAVWHGEDHAGKIKSVLGASAASVDFVNHDPVSQTAPESGRPLRL